MSDHPDDVEHPGDAGRAEAPTSPPTNIDVPAQQRSPVWDAVDELFAPKSRQPATDAIVRDRGRYELDPPELAGHIVTAVRALLGLVDTMTDHGYEGFATALYREDVPLPAAIMAQVRAAAQREQQDPPALAVRLIAEGVQMQGHTRIRFHGPAHDRCARLWNGPDVWEVISEVLGVASAEELDLDQQCEQISTLVATRYDLDPADVAAAIEFWLAHPSEVDRAIADNERWSRAATLAAERAGSAEATLGAIRLAYADLVSADAAADAEVAAAARPLHPQPSAGRDPARIDPVLDALSSAWKTLPDLRLGQMIAAAAGTRDPFNLEEDAWLGAFHRMAGGDPTNGPLGGGS